MTIFQVRSFVQIYVNTEQFFTRKRTAISAYLHGGQLRVISDCLN